MNLIFRVKRKIFKLIRLLFHRSYGEILTLHCVVEERSILEDNRKLEVTPAYLEQTILKYQSAGYRFVSLDEVQQQIESRKRNKQKFVCFTLDDGYADNYKLAYPVFKKYNCPFAIYVTTDFPDKKVLIWWYSLEDVLLKNEKLILNGVEYDCSDMTKKNLAFREIRNKVFSDAENTIKALENLFKENEEVIRFDVNELVLSWEQIVDLAAEPLCTISAHTVSHLSLPDMSDEEIRKELSDGKQKIENRIQMPVKHFAYPFGNWNTRVECLVMEQYDTAALVCGGLVREGDSLYRLYRNNLIEK